MGKRSDFKKIEKDKYMTVDPRAVQVLIPFLKAEGIKTFVEPCVGNYDLADTLEIAGFKLVRASDIEANVRTRDSLRDCRTIDEEYVEGADAIITNPPWSRPVLHEVIKVFSELAPTWLLFDSGWAYTAQSSEYIKRCTDIVPIGRLRWIPDTKMQGKDDCAWYRFEKDKKGLTVFHGR